MANEEQLSILKQGVEVSNEWRFKNRDIGIDLSFADLHSENLRMINFSEANLVGADLRRANLQNAYLILAKLRRANLALSRLLDWQNLCNL